MDFFKLLGGGGSAAPTQQRFDRRIQVSDATRYSFASFALGESNFCMNSTLAALLQTTIISPGIGPSISPSKALYSVLRTLSDAAVIRRSPMFGLGWPEVTIILIVALLIFGPKKIPELGGAIGKTLRGFKEEINQSDDDLLEGQDTDDD